MSIAARRRMADESLRPALERAQGLYPVDTVATTLGGVRAKVITPKGGIPIRNQHRVLMSLHGGGFLTGAGTLSLLESIPAASLGRIKVVAIDYRQGPEHRFPAATEDVAAVYRELLRSYPARNIGIYGCSAGGVLTGEVVAWIEKKGGSLPGAIGIFCASAAGWNGGDSGSLADALNGEPVSAQYGSPPHPSIDNAVYFREADFSDPLVEPIRSNAVLARFPPTLIITSTRDIALSPAVYTHTQLVKLGVDAQLHVWEAMVHGFFGIHPELPESREAWDVIVKFFDSRLGT